MFSGRCWRFVECCGDDAVQDDQESPLPSCEVVTLSGPPRKRVYGLRSCVQPPRGRKQDESTPGKHLPLLCMVRGELGLGERPACTIFIAKHVGVGEAVEQVQPAGGAPSPKRFTAALDTRTINDKTVDVFNTDVSQTVQQAQAGTRRDQVAQRGSVHPPKQGRNTSRTS